MLMVHMLCLTKQSTAQYEVTSVNPVEKNITFPNLLPLPIFFYLITFPVTCPKLNTQGQKYTRLYVLFILK